MTVGCFGKIIHKIEAKNKNTQKPWYMYTKNTHMF